MVLRRCSHSLHAVPTATARYQFRIIGIRTAVR